jgi:hypothetical protein
MGEISIVDGELRRVGVAPPRYGGRTMTVRFIRPTSA